MVRGVCTWCVAAATLLAVAGAAWTAPAQSTAVVSSRPGETRPAYEARIRWWREARFGLFVHWGPVSLAGTEIGWSRGAERRGIGGKGEVPVEVYDTLYERFRPTRYDAGQWAALAKAAGMRYGVLTTKHHDGFCMFDSALTDYKVTRSPFGRDVTAEFASAFRAAGLKVGFYHSPPDWRHPDYRTERHARYIDYLHGQVRELMSRYGPVDILWFDGLGGTADDWRAAPMVAEAHRLQPGILVNNRAGLQADFDTPEQEIGHYQLDRPWETCMTLGDQWSYRPNDRIKSLKQCIHTLARCAGGDGNLLLNVGPMPTGEIEPSQAQRLREIGAWLRKRGRSIYATRGGPFRPGPWGASTCKGRTVFLHVLEWPDEGDLELPTIDRRVVSARLLPGGQAAVRQTPDGTFVSVEAGRRDPIDTVVELTLDGPAFGTRLTGGAGVPVTIGRAVRASNVHQGDPTWSPERAVDDNMGTRWATDAGVTAAWLEVELGAETVVDRAEVHEAIPRVREYRLQAWRGGAWVDVARGDTIGARREIRFAPTPAARWRLDILRADDGPTLYEFHLFAARKAAGSLRR